MAFRDAARVSLRVLQVGALAANSAVLRFAASRGARLTVLDPCDRRLERARLSGREALDAQFCGDLDGLPDGEFDIVVSAGGLSRLNDGREALARLSRKCASGAALIAVEPTPSLFHAVALGLAEAPAAERHARRIGPEAWASACAEVGFRKVEARLVETGQDQSTLLVAEAPEAASVAPPSRVVEILSAGAVAPGYAEMLRDAVGARGAACRIAERGLRLGKGQASTLVWLAGERKGDGVARVAAHCLALRDLALGLGQTKARLFVAVPAADRPMAEALVSFARTLSNEFPSLDVRRVVAADSSRRTAERFAEIVLSDSVETDLSIESDGVRVLRYARTANDPGSASGELGARLGRSPEAGLDRLAWRSIQRVEPKANEVEIEVTATGLNFRDIMLALSILPDEMLEDGYAGPTLGLEFAGRVARVGAAVQHLKPGDEVVGLGSASFATHAVVDANLAAPLPPTLRCEDAAGVPVAFLTAYYGLISCADLQPGEWALVHGGAGGVGLAALQIARWRGARVIATAGSAEKRALVRALGAEHAFDSRSGGFADEVMSVTGGEGVSVVLNSLAGEAMERSLGLLRPFGRFVELGKRDYLADTPLGLRPFRRNLSYFGVDLDQLLSARPELSRRLFDEVLALFASGDLRPLPYTLFAHDEVGEAVRLMQQSGHVGKILVRPPPPGAVRPRKVSAKGFAADPDRTHLVTGGLGGFGLATAEWLVDRGARHLALVGRSGAASDAAKEAVAALAARGVNVRVGALDVADRHATERFMADLNQSMPPLAGVMHAAMILDDATVANLDEARLIEVLKPKIAGAETLDRLTRNLPLDYFVLFSSATTIIGNPGQSAYVAANGYLEGLAIERRSAGFPALAVAWGAIADVGVVARHGSTRRSLARRAGVEGIRAAVALEATGAALMQPDGDASVVIADINWTAARSSLALLASPSYGRLARRDASPSAAPDRVVDVAELIKRLGPERARRAVADILVDEVARILQLPRDAVNRTKPLAEIGLDSLMAMELTLSLENRFRLDSPLAAVAGSFNVSDLASHVIAEQAQDGLRFDVAKDLARRHLSKADWPEIESLMTALVESGVDLAGARRSESG
jgi:NADPH:quinone reductase-like Zn-dependent oxidoreductase/acyl carrier protein